jgi:hypothetical protein
MTTITLDPQPDGPECFRIDATTAPLNAPPSDDRPRLVCEWKRTADGRLTATWTLRDANLASLPELSPEEMTLEPDVRQDRFLVWILRPPREVRTILGTAAAVLFLGLATAYLSRSTTANSRQTGHASMATTAARSAKVDNVQAPVVDPNFSSELPAGSAGAWIRPPTLRP